MLVENKSAHERSDRWAAQAQRGAPLNWCVPNIIRRYASFTVNAHGREEDSRLALEWSQKLEHFHNIWCEQANPRYEYTVSDLASYVPMPLGQVLREIWLMVVQPKKEPMA